LHAQTPQGRRGAYSAPPDPLAGFKVPTSKGRGREGRKEEERDPHLALVWGPQMVNQALNKVVEITIKH